MEKKISEMTLEELQDYAIEQENTIKAKDEELANERSSKLELQELNLSLQKRNKELFLKVEQSPSLSSFQGQEGPKEEPTQSCEDFAKNLSLK